jgi:hypothetical protein
MWSDTVMQHRRFWLVQERSQEGKTLVQHTTVAGVETPCRVDEERRLDHFGLQLR